MDDRTGECGPPEALHIEVRSIGLADTLLQSGKGENLRDPRPGFAALIPAKPQERHRDIFRHREGRQQMRVREKKTERPVAKFARGLRLEIENCSPQHLQVSGIRTLDHAEHIH